MPTHSHFLMERSFSLLDWFSKCTCCRDTARNIWCCFKRCNWFWFGSLACNIWERKGSYKKNVESSPSRALDSTWSSMLVSPVQSFFLPFSLQICWFVEQSVLLYIYLMPSIGIWITCATVWISNPNFLVLSSSVDLWPWSCSWSASWSCCPLPH